MAALVLDVKDGSALVVGLIDGMGRPGVDCEETPETGDGSGEVDEPTRADAASGSDGEDEVTSAAATFGATSEEDEFGGASVEGSCFASSTGTSPSAAV